MEVLTLDAGSNSKVCRRVELRVLHCGARLGNTRLLQEFAADDARVASGLFKNTNRVIGQEVGQNKASVFVFGILRDLEYQ